MENPYINHLAVFVCALLSLVIGALWYSPLLFFKAWQRQTGLTDEQIAKAKPIKTYSLTLVLALMYFCGIVILQRLFVALTGQQSTLAVVVSSS